VLCEATFQKPPVRRLGVDGKPAGGKKRLDEWKNFNNYSRMQKFPSISLRFVGKFILLGVFATLFVGVAQAQDQGKPQKYRGHIISVDLEGKSITLSTPKGAQKVVVWDESTKIESPIVVDYTDLKPGMYFRCIMVGKTEVASRLRHELELDNLPDQPAPTE
jgi:hypothetical protein